jgi:16S rRNA (uracil1498-N3)-methyltransferase
MHRFFVKPDQIRETQISIDGEDFRHITRVLRLGKDDCIEVCDGQGTDYQVVLEAPGSQSVTGQIKESHPSQGETAGLQVTLFQGLPKGTKMEVIIQKSVELGVREIVPFASVRAVAQVTEKKDKKTERWQRIAYEAAKQSKRGLVPVVRPPQSLKGILAQVAAFDLLLLAYEDENRQTLREVLTQFGQKNNGAAPLKIGVIVGPEGGFDKTEVDQCTKAGVASVSLGKRILRTETAGMVVLSQLNFWQEGLINNV